MDSLTKWQARISKLDELNGRKPKYPHALLQYNLENIFNEQNDVLNNVSIDIRKNIERATSNVSGSIEHGFDLLMNSNTKGFNLINNSINNIADINKEGFDKVIASLENISVILDKSFSKIIELNKQRNVLLDDVIQLLNIPDDEKRRKKIIEKGLDFLKKSEKDKSVISIAKTYFEQALELDKEDYFVLYNLGYINLFSNEHLDLNKAKEYFLLSAKFSYLDIDFEKEQFTKHLSSFKTTFNPKLIATYSYFYAAHCEYILKNYSYALKYIKKAFDIMPDLIVVMYDLSRYLAINNKVDEAIVILDKAIIKDRNISQAVYLDKNKDLIAHSKVVDYLENIKLKAIEKGRKIYFECKKEISNDSTYINDLRQVEKYLNKDKYLDAMKALDILI